MEVLQHLLPEEEKKAKLSYIKVNTVVNKATSNFYGFPKMLKKADMNNKMLATRDKVQDDYLKLYEVFEDTSTTKEAIYKKYQQKLITKEV